RLRPGRHDRDARGCAGPRAGPGVRLPGDRGQLGGRLRRRGGDHPGGSAGERGGRFGRASAADPGVVAGRLIHEVNGNKRNLLIKLIVSWPRYLHTRARDGSRISIKRKDYAASWPTVPSSGSTTPRDLALSRRKTG